MAKTIPIGIDLGTTNSAVATIDQSGHTVMIGNAEGELLTPSIVHFSEDEVVVGKEARKAGTSTPEAVAQWAKRDMGQEAYSRPIQGRYMPPEVIEACILEKLKSDIAGSVGHRARVVITVPAYFDDLRRNATANAGEMAGLKVLDIVNEPMAAALAFGETLGYLSPSQTPKEELTVLVYDLGGGTFDATLLKLTQGNVQTLATDGDVQLGGYDWDQLLAAHLAGQFVAEHGVDPRVDPAGSNRLLGTVEEIKHALSARKQTTARLEHNGASSEFTVTRETFEQLTAGLVERTAYTCRQLLTASGLQWSNISRVLLVGGSTRMPMISDMLRKMTGLEPERSVNPDEAVARGAALYASFLLSKGLGDVDAGDAEAGGAEAGDGGIGKREQPAGVGFDVTNVNSHSLGVAGTDPTTLRETNTVLIARNTPLPATRTERFTTKRDGQSSIVVQVLEGESSMPEQCTAIGRTVIRGLPSDLKKGWPVEVTFEYSANGRLKVDAQVPGTHGRISLVLERTVELSSAGMARWKEVVGSAAGASAFHALAKEEPPVEAEVVDERAGTGGGGGGELPPSAQPDGERRFRVPSWIFWALGYGTAAIVGLAVGYVMLSFLRPDIFPVPW